MEFRDQRYPFLSIAMTAASQAKILSEKLKVVGIGSQGEPQTLILGLSAFVISIILSVALIKRLDLQSCPEDIRPEIQKIVALENQFSLKEIDERVYKEKRHQLIAKIMKQMDDGDV